MFEGLMGITRTSELGVYWLRNSILLKYYTSVLYAAVLSSVVLLVLQYHQYIINNFIESRWLNSGERCLIFYRTLLFFNTKYHLPGHLYDDLGILQFNVLHWFYNETFIYRMFMSLIFDFLRSRIRTVQRLHKQGYFFLNKILDCDPAYTLD